jgi:hypothetical protein
MTKSTCGLVGGGQEGGGEMWLRQVAWGETVFCEHASPARSVKQTLWMVLLEIMGGGIFRHLIAQVLSAGITSLKNPNKFLCNVKLMGSLLRQTKSPPCTLLHR